MALDGLGSEAILSKIDKLRELSIGSLIPLPQASKALTGQFVFSLRELK